MSELFAMAATWIRFQEFATNVWNVPTLTCALNAKLKLIMNIIFLKWRNLKQISERLKQKIETCTSLERDCWEDSDVMILRLNQAKKDSATSTDTGEENTDTTAKKETNGDWTKKSSSWEPCSEKEKTWKSSLKKTQSSEQKSWLMFMSPRITSAWRSIKRKETEWRKKSFQPSLIVLRKNSTMLSSSTQI